MTLNVKDPEAYRLAHRLAERTGETLTRAVIVAVRERLDRLERDDGAVAERLMEIGRDVASRLPEEVRGRTHGSLLYGDDGLPR